MRPGGHSKSQTFSWCQEYLSTTSVECLCPLTPVYLLNLVFYQMLESLFAIPVRVVGVVGRHPSPGGPRSVSTVGLF